MYGNAEYLADLSKAGKPVVKASAVFWKSLLKRDPYKSFGPCCLMIIWLMWFSLQFAFFTGRRLINL